MIFSSAIHFTWALVQHAFLLFTFQHKGVGLPVRASGGFIAVLLACGLLVAGSVSPQLGIGKLVVWSIVGYFSPAIAAAGALLSGMEQLIVLMGMDKGVAYMWGFTAYVLVAVKIMKA